MPLASAGTQRARVSRPRVETMKVTPKLAEDWLGHNSHNRGLRNAHVEELAGAMRRGEWMMNGDAIRFAIDGTLLDGQHRLWAIVESATAIMSLVVFDLPLDAQDTMDLAKRRNLKDVLQLRGEPNAASLAATLTLKWRLDEGFVRYTSRRPSVAQALAVLQEHPGMREAVKAGHRLKNRFRISGAVISVCWYEFTAFDPVLAETFINRLFDGMGLQEGSPLLALRRWMERQANSAAGARSSSVMAHALFIKAWNALREGRHIDQLHWRAATEAFPEAK